MDRDPSQHDTLMLVELVNAHDVAAELGPASQELFVDEFETRIRQLGRRRDEIVRVQPTKFCVILRDVNDRQQIELAGAKLERLFEENIQLLDEEIRPRVHASFVPPTSRATDTKKRLQVAEAGLREARSEKRFWIIRDALAEKKIDQTHRRTREVESAFSNGEFVMYFQPKVHAAYRNVVGAEALMRWHSPERGVLLPGEFFPFIKEIELQTQFTWFALKAALATASTWPDGIGVAVNIPAAVIHDPVLFDVVGDSLKIFDLEPKRLTLEITEEAMIHNPERAIVNLDSLRALGARIAIDDFGTGYSSLAYFRNLPVDELKVDRAFVTHMLSETRDRDIVKAVIDLAHNFSMQVVAEGVEDAETAEALQRLGCDVLQGFFFGEPAPADEFAASL